MAKKRRLRPLHPLLRNKYLLRITAAFVVIWLITVLFFMLRASHISKAEKERKIPKASDEDSISLQEQVAESVARRKELHEVNQELKRKLESALDMQKSVAERLAGEAKFNETASSSALSSDAMHHIFSKEYESSRRKITRSLWEILQVFRQSPLWAGNGSIAGHIENQFYSLLANSLKLAEIDGAAEWRRRSLQSITATIQKKLWDSQNPEDCRERKFVICDMKQCGFGCQIHHLAYCLLVSFASRRTLVMSFNGSKWTYHKRGWAAMLEEISQCSSPKPVEYNFTADENTNLKLDSRKFIRLEYIEYSHYRPEILPLAIPKPLADQLIMLHSNPPVFFISQFIWYLMTMKPHAEKIVNAVSSQIPFDAGPIVGLHIRRGDKLDKEAKYHKVEEYMAWSDIYFQIQDRIQKRNVTRRVYVASDDPTVLPEVRSMYPNYEVYGNVHFAEAAKKRYTERSLRGLLSDVMMLSKCSYLVCTFSSHFCRLAYELMQVRHGDAGDSFHSLDDDYYFGGQIENDFIAVEGHTAQDSSEINLRTGDLISHKKNQPDGYAIGFNKRTQERGKFPLFKVEEQWRIVDFSVLNE